MNAGRVLIGRMPSEKARYASVFDGRVPRDGEPHDAAIVEAGERGAAFGFAVAIWGVQSRWGASTIISRMNEPPYLSMATHVE